MPFEHPATRLVQRTPSEAWQDVGLQPGANPSILTMGGCEEQPSSRDAVNLPRRLYAVAPRRSPLERCWLGNARLEARISRA